MTPDARPARLGRARPSPARSTPADLSLSFSYSNLAVPNEDRYDNPDIRNW